jgi:hypothetical protein
MIGMEEASTERLPRSRIRNAARATSARAPAPSNGSIDRPYRLIYRLRVAQRLMDTGWGIASFYG